MFELIQEMKFVKTWEKFCDNRLRNEVCRAVTPLGHVRTNICTGRSLYTLRGYNNLNFTSETKNLNMHNKSKKNIISYIHALKVIQKTIFKIPYTLRLKLLASLISNNLFYVSNIYHYYLQIHQKLHLLPEGKCETTTTTIT